MPRDPNQFFAGCTSEMTFQMRNCDVSAVFGCLVGTKSFCATTQNAAVAAATVGKPEFDVN